LALVGESGCGKTTLAMVLLGLQRPTVGEVLFKGIEMSSTDRHEVARHVQPVFQDPYSSLNPRKTLMAIISMPLVVHRQGSTAQRKGQVEKIMKMVGLPRRLLYSYPNQLSGGQRQRVAIARALALKPDVIICDEPTSALDVSVQAQILDLLLDLRAELGLTYVFISHDLAVVEHIATQVAVMYLGRIIEKGTAEQVFDNPRHPYTQLLLASVLTPEPKLGLPEVEPGATMPNPLEPPAGCPFHPRCPHADHVCRTARPPVICDGAGLLECHLFGSRSS
jgi:peptide/nickel transport system ATP-binding protein